MSVFARLARLSCSVARAYDVEIRAVPGACRGLLLQFNTWYASCKFTHLGNEWVKESKVQHVRRNGLRRLHGYNP